MALIYQGGTLMKIIMAEKKDFKNVKNITTTTIESIYPHYYPYGAVEFFLNHHNDSNIQSDIESGIVYLCIDDNNAVGTVTVRENEICRLFVLPEYQGKGFGRELISFAEKKISETFSTIILDASLPAKSIYLKRGYVTIEYHSIKTDNGDYLCYDLMEKRIN